MAIPANAKKREFPVNVNKKGEFGPKGDPGERGPKGEKGDTICPTYRDGVKVYPSDQVIEYSHRKTTDILGSVTFYLTDTNQIEGTKLFSKILSVSAIAIDTTGNVKTSDVYLQTDPASNPIALVVKGSKLSTFPVILNVRGIKAF